jgi:hypothetical protein
MDPLAVACGFCKLVDLLLRDRQPIAHSDILANASG